MDDALNGTLRYRVDRLERDVDELGTTLKELNQKIDRLILTFVSGSIAITTSIVAATIALLAQ